jgi:hypothetical protein
MGGVAGGAGGKPGAAPAGVPHEAQNFAPATSSVPQFMQCAGAAAIG